MAQGRYRLQHKSKGLVMEHHYPQVLAHVRRVDKRFKRARIIHILQMLPSKVQVGVAYQHGEPV